MNSTRLVKPLTIILSMVFLAIFFTSCSLDISLPSQYAIVYGVAIYDVSQGEGEYPNLSYTNDDAEDVAELLRRKDYEVILRTDTEATKEQLYLDVEQITTLASEDSSFIFYFSGHGGQDSDIYSIFSRNRSSEAEGRDSDEEWIFLHGSLPIDPLTPEEQLNLALNDNELYEIIAEIPSLMKTVIIDACNSGGFLGSSAEYDMVPQNYQGSSLGFRLGDEDNGLSAVKSAFSLYLNFNSSDTTDIPASKAIVLAAAGEQEFSYEYTNSDENNPVDPQNGVFTHFLLQSPQFGDTNDDGYITVIEAFSYTSRRIQQTWNTRYASQYNFLPHVSGGAVDYVLFKSD